MNEILIILSLVVLTSYAPNAVPNEVPSKNLVERDGIKYEVFSKVPFTGSFVRYHENGQLEIRRNYKDGKEHGLREWYYENGQLRIKGNVKDGKLDGLTERYDRNGKDISNSSYETYYENGQLKSKGNYKDGQYDGLWES